MNDLTKSFDFYMEKSCDFVLLGTLIYSSKAIHGFIPFTTSLVFLEFVHTSPLFEETRPGFDEQIQEKFTLGSSEKLSAQYFS
jgi:hypothetical protein